MERTSSAVVALGAAAAQDGGALSAGARFSREEASDQADVGPGGSTSGGGSVLC